MGGIARTARPPSLPVADMRVLLDPDGWLITYMKPDTIALYEELSSTINGHPLEWSPRRCRNSSRSDALQDCLLSLDLRCLCHALDSLRSLTGFEVRRVIPLLVRDALPKGTFDIDHIGVEVFGRLDWYLEALRPHYRQLGFEYLREHIFPSVQVRKALSDDPKLGDVRIARVFLQMHNRVVNLEIFEVEQAWQYTAWRQFHLFSHLARPGMRLNVWTRHKNRVELPCPVGHIAVRVQGWQTVADLHRKLARVAAQPRSPIVLYSDSLDFNPGDMSANTKLISPALAGDGTLLRNRIMEVLSYGDRRAAPRLGGRARRGTTPSRARPTRGR